MSRERRSLLLALMRSCPTCAGGGREPYDGDWGNGDAEMVECTACDGCGDLLAAIVRRAYEAGRTDALDQARYGLESVSRMLAAAPPNVTARGLIQRVRAR